MDTFSDREVTLHTAVQDVLGSIPDSGKDFNVFFFVLFLLYSYFFVQKYIIYMNLCNFAIPFN